jgi:hypothetical protein
MWARPVDNDHRSVVHRLLAVIAVASAIACGVNGAASAPTNAPAASLASATSSRTPEVTKPPFSQPPLPAPTRVAWAIDRGEQPERPYVFELHYDGNAMGFRVVDASGQLVLQVPIAGSGVFGPETCVVALQQPGKTTNATWRSIDDATYRDFVAHAASYRVEVETVGHGTITLPLGDSGCRR